MPIFVWNVTLVSLIFLKVSLVFPSLLFSSIYLHWSLTKAFLSLLAILWNSAFKWVYLSLSPLFLASFLFLALCKVSSDNHFAFLHFSFLGMVLTTASYTVSGTSVHSSSDTLSIRSNLESISHFHSIIWFRSYLNGLVNPELPVQAGFRKHRGTRDKIANMHWIIRKEKEFQKLSTSTSLTMLKPLTVCITTNWKIQEMEIPDHLICQEVKFFSREKSVCRSWSNS